MEERKERKVGMLFFFLRTEQSVDKRRVLVLPPMVLVHGRKPIVPLRRPHHLLCHPEVRQVLRELVGQHFRLCEKGEVE